jgi:hypothetical protein
LRTPAGPSPPATAPSNAATPTPQPCSPGRPATIADALATGATLPELADELGLPGGAVEIDGPHIDQRIAALPTAAGEATTETPPAPPTSSAGGQEHGWGPLPPEMIDGMQERRTAPAEVDRPADLRARLDELRERLAQATGTTGDAASSWTGADDARDAELTHWARQDERTDNRTDGDDLGQGW